MRLQIFIATAILSGPLIASPPPPDHSLSAHITACSGTPTAEHPQSRSVLKALTQPSQTERRTLLEQYLASNPDSSSAVDRVALNRARLTLAAEYLNESRFQESRQLLTQIELDSPIAVQASLLLAESFRLEGDHARAGQWLLRTGQRYGSDPDALSSLLDKASTLHQTGQLNQAFTLYNMVQSSILDNAEQITALRSETDQLIERLLRTRLDESRATQSQLLKQMIHSTDNGLLLELGQLARDANLRRCLSRQQQQLAQSVFESSSQIARITPFLTMLEREEAMLNRRLEQLQHATDENARLEREELEQQRLAVHQQRETLLTQKQQLPDAAARLHQELGQQIGILDEATRQRRAVIMQQLAQLSSTLMSRYRELAAESQYGRASVLHKRHRGS